MRERLVDGIWTAVAEKAAIGAWVNTEVGRSGNRWSPSSRKRGRRRRSGPSRSGIGCRRRAWATGETS